MYKVEYTQINSKLGLCQEGTLSLLPSEAGAEVAKLKKFSDSGGRKMGGFPT